MLCEEVSSCSLLLFSELVQDTTNLQEIKNILINYSRSSRRIEEEDVMNELRGGDVFPLKVENSKTTPIP
jgi:hypothetical protein